MPSSKHANSLKSEDSYGQFPRSTLRPIFYSSHPTPPPHSFSRPNSTEVCPSLIDDEDRDKADDGDYDEQGEDEDDDEDGDTDGSQPGADPPNHEAASAAGGTRAVDLSANIRDASRKIDEDTGLEEIINEGMLAIQRAMSQENKHLSKLRNKKRGIEEVLAESDRKKLISTLEWLTSEADHVLSRLEGLKNQIGKARKRIRGLGEDEDRDAGGVYGTAILPCEGEASHCEPAE